jgi:septum formation protein
MTPVTPMTRVILASTSRARAALLAGAGIDAEAFAPGVDEAALKAGLGAEGASPRDIADALAEAKAVKVSRRRGGLVIGADMTLDLDGALYDKPASLAEARTHLLAFRGRTHSLHSAVVIAEEGAPVWRHVSSARLTLRAFSDAFLDAYIAGEGEALLTAVGCYRLEGLGAQLFERIEGDYFSILGLPLLPVLAYLRERGAVAP